MLLKSKLKELKTILKSENILSELEECYCYSSDALNKRENVKIPDLVVFVETIEDVQRVLKYANQHLIPIIPRGAGTNMVGSCVCNCGGIVLNFSKMNKILAINVENLTAKVQPGVVLGDFKNLVETKNLFFPPDPSNYKVSTIGGGIAQSSGGAKAFKYGTFKDYVLSLKVVTANGDLMTIGVDTIKESVGYHLAQLFVGSEGTLGIIVEATLKLIPKPQTRKVVSVYFDKLQQVMQTVNTILQNNISPSAIDFMDKNSIQTVEAFAQCGLNTDKEFLVIIELEGAESNVNSEIDIIKTIFSKNNIQNYHIAQNEEEAEKIWNARRVSYSAATRLANDVLSDDIIVPRDNLEKMISTCLELAKDYELKMCLVGHFGDGDIHPQIALDLDNETEFRNYSLAKSKMYETAISLGGTISGEHGIGIEKKSYIDKIVDKTALDYMKSIKKIFDPNNILNPNKIFKI